MRPSAAIGTSSRVTPYEVFVLCLSIWAIVSLAAESTFALSPATSTILEFSDNVLCAIFFADFLHSLWASPDRWKYMRSWGWIDLLSSIPAVDALRIGRIGRLVRILRVVRTIRSARLIIRYIIQRKRESAVLAGVLL